MSNPVRPLFITGASRSGTSMTAGLFHAHGLWFGPCQGASPINPKGFFEALYLQSNQGGYHTPANDAEGWAAWLRERGAPQQWAVKAGPQWWPVFEEFDPVVVACYRDRSRIIESRARAGFGMTPESVDVAWSLMADIDRRIECWPDQFVAGDFSSLLPAFDALGIEFDQSVAGRWVDPTPWTK